MIYLSKEKQSELEIELVDLKTVRIPDLAKRIDDARQLGDLSENAEYHAAREDMAWAQTRAREVEHILDTSEIVAAPEKKGVISIGSQFSTRTGEKERTFTIVGAQEADPSAGKISNESPLGSAFMGRKKGDTVDVVTPVGTQKFVIEHIQ